VVKDFRPVTRSVRVPADLFMGPAFVPGRVKHRVGLSMKQLKISLPDDLRSQLDAATESSGQSLAEEIRLRLERTFYLDAFDPQTRELAAAVMRMADQIQRDTGYSWHLRPEAHKALAAALQSRLTRIKPPLPEGVGASDLLNAEFLDDPETLGRAIERHDARFEAELQKGEQELREIHKRGKP
jgi:hypothetical protein